MTIFDLLQDYNVPYALPGQHHHARRGWIQVECWSCSPYSQKYKVGINTSSLAVNCWTCGVTPLPHALVEILHVTPQEAYSLAKQLREGVGLSPQEAFPIRRRGRVELPKGVDSLLPAHKRYLKDRGFDPDVLVKLWGIGGIGIATNLAWRIFIPVHYGGETVTWTTRALVDEGLRYVNANPEQEKIPIKETLFGLDYVKHSTIICEGPFDVMKIGPGAVCLFGLNYSQAQERLLTSIPVRYICFDTEPVAQQRARQLINSLAVFPGETYNIELDSKDPAGSSTKEIKQLRKLLE